MSTNLLPQGVVCASLVAKLSDQACSDSPDIGSKAASLGRLAQAGFPVPNGFVITMRAYERFMAANNLGPGSTPEMVLAAPFPAEVAADVRAALAEIGDGPLAVRSSGVAEDLAGASFAGQYETVLGVRGAEAVENAVRRCWASAFEGRVATYRAAQGHDGTGGMAVLVQRLIPAEAAGVAFTANPVTGDRTETLVSAVRGLGDRLVSGEASPDEWIVRDGRATPRSAPEGAVDADKALAVAGLARRVETHYGGVPQDIEWALADGDVYLLQARPITTLSDQPPAQVEVAVEPPPGFWLREASHAPVPWTPMSRFWLYGARNAAGKRMFDEFGFLMETIEMREIGGWEYMRLVPLGGKDRPAPPAWLMPLMIRLVPQLRQRIKQCVAAVRADRPGQLLHEWETHWQPDLAARASQLRDVDLASLSDVELDEHTESASTLLEDGIEVHFILHGAVGSALADLVFTARDLLNWDEAQVYAMLNGLSAKSTEPSRRLADLAAMAGQRPAVRDLLEQVDEHTLDRIADVDAEFAVAFSAYQREYGYRCLRYEIADPTLMESPTLVLSLIRDQVVLGFDPSAADAQSEEQRTSVVAAARKSLARRPAEEQRRFDRALARAEKAYPVREDNEFHTASAPLALVRLAVLEMGRRLAQRGLLARRDDVFFLELHEARAALRGAEDHSVGSVTSPRTLVERRRAERAWVEAHPGPASYGKNPGPPPSFRSLPLEARSAMEALMWSVESVMAAEQSQRVQVAGEALRGIPASAGRYTGRVRRIMSEAEFGRLQPGDVMVCPITSPVWSVLFPSIGALVTDTGGTLSHPAIIAREYRVPAVVATGNATSLLQDDQMVTVDGTTGTVEVHR